MNATQCRRATRAQTSSGRFRTAAFAGLAVAAIVCGHTSGQQDPADVGEWNDPLNTGPDWDVLAMHAAHLPTGSILVWETPGDASLWDPLLDAFTPMPTTLFIGCSGHAGLADGTILFAGGSGSTVETKIFSLEGLPGGPWQQVEDMTYGRFYPTCTTLPDGRVLATVGTAVLWPEIFNPGNDPLQGTWEVVNIWTDGISLYYPHMFVVPDPDPNVQKVFFSSGYQAQPFDENYMLDIGALTWEAVGGDPLFRTFGGSAVMYEPGIVLKCGGGNNSGTLGNTATIDLTEATPAWQLEQSMFNPREEHNLVLVADGKILAVGGKNEMGAVKVAEWFDPNDPFLPHWEELAAMSIGRAHHSTAVLLVDGRVLSAGGEDGFGDPDGTAQIFSPPYLFWGDPPKIGFAPTAVSYGSEFSVILTSGSPVPAEAIDKVSFLRLGSVTHGFDMNQRYVPLVFEPDSLVPNTLIVQAPAHGNIAPPGYYMLFVISDDGVPSVAKYVRLVPPITP